MKEQIKEEFRKLHQFLVDEQAELITKLEVEVQQKIESLGGKIEKIKQEIRFLSDTSDGMKVELQSEDIKFLKVRLSVCLSIGHLSARFF